LEGNTGRKFLGAVIVPTVAGWAALAEYGKRALTQKLRGALMPFMELAAVPRKWRFVRIMPATDQGKIILAQLQALFSQSPDTLMRPTLLDRKASATTLELKLKLPPELKYFDGHFDGHPILAGVIQLGWAIEYARESFSLNGTVERIDALKFFRVLRAGEEVKLELELEREKDKLTFKYNSAQHAHSAGRIQFGVAA
jgi:3-hydroxymyristoyl/3-hydroxydecanoyl-(acyl carrier protein) dehydratase